MLINSFHLHVFLNLDKACAQFADLMLVFINQHLMDFVMDTKISSNHIDFCLFSTVDHVKNTQSCVNHVNAHRDTYGGTYENRSSFSTCLQDPKILYVDLGYGHVLWPHSVSE